MTLHRAVLAALLATAACAPSRPRVVPNIDPGRGESPAMPVPPAAIAGGPARSLPPEEAFRRGLMPLSSTGVPEFLRANPESDGRGVLIGILDSGIDPGVAGLGTTSTGEPKILDLRDFSGEGSVALGAVTPDGDTVTVAGRALAGFGRVLAYNHAGPWYAGVIAELPLGEPPASDLNGNGRSTDTLAIIVTRASDGWILLTDTNGDGSLADERPVHDYLAGRETFGWRTGSVAPPVTVAANFAEQSGAPTLDLVFDNGGHGTHVAGIAAGHDLYGVAGFNGVAPGARLLGLKIANDAQGGLSATGAMVAAADYAIRFAAERHMPLVLNLSFGVGNEIEGRALIDAAVDSILEANPDVVWVISAGNEGPGLSTVGFPGSARRALTVGATIPLPFLQGAEPGASEPIAFFSGRGGEVAKPEVVAPGVAYSTVPAWKTGDEQANGTSMAAPYASGLVALLRSRLLAAGVAVDARTLRHALMVTARPVAGETFIEQGAGEPDIRAAFAWLETGKAPAAITATALGGTGLTAAWRGAGLRNPGDTLQEFLLRRPAGPPATYALRSSAGWLAAPDSVTLAGTDTRLTLRYRADALQEPGVYTATVSGWTGDTVAGPAFRLVNTVVVPLAAGDSTIRGGAPVPIPAGGQTRLFFPVDSGRPFTVIARSGEFRHQVLVFLHEPGGMPQVGGEPQAVPFGEDARFDVDGHDARRGIWQLVAVAPPTRPTSAAFLVRQSPVTLRARRDSADAVVTLDNVSPRPVDTRAGLALVGGERNTIVVSSGSARVDVPLALPSWATAAEVDVEMDPEQWGDFTDFGVTLFDSIGVQLAKAPLNYALGRLTWAPEAPPAGAMPLRLSFFPGLARPAATDRWTARVSIRFYAAKPRTLTPAASAAVHLAPGASGEFRFGFPGSPWPLDAAYFPLGIVSAEVDGQVWTRELGLPRPTPPVMP